MKTLRRTDVAIIGGGWTGLLIAKELAARTPLSVTILERGAPRKKEDYAAGMDELDYNVRFSMMQDYSRETATLRHTRRDHAVPIRQLGSFMPGQGTGGAGEHWGGVFPRFVPDIFEILSSTRQRYGDKRLPEDHAMVDWGVTWNEIEPYYTRADKLVGSSGKAGNLRGQKIEGGNIFEGPRSEEYPTPPTKMPYYATIFGEAAKHLGYHPYPNPAATTSISYTNPDGVARPGCLYCGFCDRFGCRIGAKAQPTNTLLPLLQKQSSVTIHNGCSVRRIVYEKSPGGGRVTGVNYVDADGEEIFQPADLVFLGSWTLNNTRLLLLSGIGEPYDPATGKGVIGRNLTHQVSFTAATAFFEKPLNRFMGAAPAGMRIADFDGDVMDHGNLQFLRGGTMAGIGQGYQPIVGFGTLPPSVRVRWGSEWKKQSVYWYDRTGAVGFAGEHIPYRDNYMDLDPTYKDHLGDPLLRLTLDWRDNERKMVEFAIAKGVELARAMGAKEVSPGAPYGAYDARRYQSTHVQGGTIMGASPERSVVNTFGQHWQAPNLFVMGASMFANNGSANPTPTVLAFTYRTADAVIDRYLKHPGTLL
jgi:gluconate 2-dehydrogenase alpha chain